MPDVNRLRLRFRVLYNVLAFQVTCPDLALGEWFEYGAIMVEWK